MTLADIPRFIEAMPISKEEKLGMLVDFNNSLVGMPLSSARPINKQEILNKFKQKNQ